MNQIPREHHAYRELMLNGRGRSFAQHVQIHSLPVADRLSPDRVEDRIVVNQRDVSDADSSPEMMTGHLDALAYWIGTE